MTRAERERYIELRVRVFALSQEMTQDPDDDAVWRAWRQCSDEVETLWQSLGQEITADPSIELEVQRRTVL